MRLFPLAIAAILTLSGTAAGAQTALKGALPARTPVDLPIAAGQASSISLGGPIRDVVVGDPTIADVSVVDGRTLVVLGKRPGVTSLLAFGAGGRALADRQIVVSEVGGGGVTVYRGAAASNYACATQCTRVSGADPAAASQAPAGTP